MLLSLLLRMSELKMLYRLYLLCNMSKLLIYFVLTISCLRQIIIKNSATNRLLNYLQILENVVEQEYLGSSLVLEHTKAILSAEQAVLLISQRDKLNIWLIMLTKNFIDSF